MPRILSLNDEMGFLQITEIFLNKAGYQHLYTTDSHEALSILRQQRIDLFIQDMLRPNINGFMLYWLMNPKKNFGTFPS